MRELLVTSIKYTLIYSVLLVGLPLAIPLFWVLSHIVPPAAPPKSDTDRVVQIMSSPIFLLILATICGFFLSYRATKEYLQKNPSEKKIGMKLSLGITSLPLLISLIFLYFSLQDHAYSFSNLAIWLTIPLGIILSTFIGSQKAASRFSK